MKNIALILLLLSAALYGLVIRDYQDQNRQTQTQLEALEYEIRSLDGELKALEAQEASLGAELDLAYQKIPSVNDQENLIRDIQKISRESGFAFTSLSFGKSHNGQLNIPQVVISFSVKGLFSDLFNFLRLIEQNQRYLGMNDIRLTISDEPVGRQVSTSITLYALYQQ